jgi:hypothetical protein
MKPLATRATFLVVLVLLAAPALKGDEWMAPRVRNIFSANGVYVVRVVPGTNTTNLGCAGTLPSSARPARGEFYAQGADRGFRLLADVELRNPVSPVDGVVTNTGHLVTFDDWFCKGYGGVIAVYGSRGDLIRRIRIDQLYDPSMLVQLPRSTSSRSWRCPVQTAGTDGDTVTVFEQLGGAFVLDARTGAFEYRAPPPESVSRPRCNL